MQKFDSRCSPKNNLISEKRNELNRPFYTSNKFFSGLIQLTVPKLWYHVEFKLYEYIPIGKKGAKETTLAIFSQPTQYVHGHRYDVTSATQLIATPIERYLECAPSLSGCVGSVQQAVKRPWNLSVLVFYIGPDAPVIKPIHHH